MSRSKYDWTKISNEFIEGILREDGSIWYPTLEDLAERYGMRAGYLRARAGAGPDGYVRGKSWYSLRSEHLARVEQLHREEAAKAKARASANFDQSCIVVARNGIAMIASWFKDAQARAVQGPDGVTAYPLIPAATLNMLSHAATNFQRLGRLALGEPSEIRADDVTVTVTEEDEFDRLERALRQLSPEEQVAFDRAFSKLTGLPPVCGADEVEA